MTRPHVASLVWDIHSGLHLAQGSAVENSGYRHTFFRHDEPIPRTDVVLIQGPYGTLVPFVDNLLSMKREERPRIAYWFQQSMECRLPDAFHDALARVCSDLRREIGDKGRFDPHATLLWPDVVRTRGIRLGSAGDISWLYSRGMLDVLALSSTVYAAYFQRHGIPALVVPRGYSPMYGHVTNEPRSVAAVWMGKARTRRRRSAIHWLRDELARRGHVLQIHDGVERPFIFGPQRTLLLNRTHFVVNLHTQPTDELSIRFYIAAANGAVVLTEPGRNKYPFVAGEHFVECRLEEMPDKITYYLQHRDEWQAISQRMLECMQRDWTLEKSVAAILAAAEARLRERNAI